MAENSKNFENQCIPGVELDCSVSQRVPRCNQGILEISAGNYVPHDVYRLLLPFDYL